MSHNRRDGVKIGGRRGFKMFRRRFGQEHLCDPRRAHFIAESSPLMVAYLDSAGEQNDDPTMVTFHPSLQQDRLNSSQLQYFCLS